jgi:hypothetical protein
MPFPRRLPSGSAGKGFLVYQEALAFFEILIQALHRVSRK